MKVLAGLEVTSKSVERMAEAIGEDIAQGEQREIQRAVQLDLPMVIGEPVPPCMCKWTGHYSESVVIPSRCLSLSSSP